MADTKDKEIATDLSQFLSYEEYLDSQIKEIDEFYLEVAAVAAGLSPHSLTATVTR